jgi:acetyl-CoA carboxylase biotin carboxyl carrier protein
VELKDIKAIIDLMKKNSISEFELERQDFKIRLKRGGISVVQADDVSLPLALPGGVTTPAIAVTTTANPASSDLEIKSPMIGTMHPASRTRRRISGTACAAS